MTNLRGHALSASGQALSEEEVSAMNEATAWYATLHSGITTGKQQHAWKDWYEANTVHQFAWETVIRVCAQFDRGSGAPEKSTQTFPSRYRKTLQHLMVAIVLGVTAMIAYQSLPFKEWRSDYATRSGERRDIVLEDGSLLTLQADTLVDVRSNGTQRVIYLHAGEIQLTMQSGAQPPDSMFVVRTPHGQIATSDGRVEVRIAHDKTLVSVLRQFVEVSTDQGNDTVRVVSGQQMTLDTGGVMHPSLMQTDAVW
jgi:transmembrane sensor